MLPTAPRCVLALAAALLAGCAAGEDHVLALADPEPELSRLAVCHGYGCSHRTTVAIAPEAWARIAASFRPPAATPAEERRRIADAVGAIEEIVGALAGTAVDKPGAALFASDIYQQDCIDETVNTTTYLRLMARAGLFVHHRVGPAAGRGHFLDRWPHNTAVVVEVAGGAAFAVDSWFHANGVPAEVVPLAAWRGGWSPAEPVAARRASR
jgi:hypothetical protein